MRSVNLGQLAELVQGELVAPPHVQDPGAVALIAITNALPLQEAAVDTVTLVDNAKHLERLNASAAAAVVTVERLEGCTKPMLVVSDLHAAFASIVTEFRPSWKPAVGVHASAVVEPSAVVGENSTIGPGATVGEGVVIGSGCSIGAGSHIAAGCQLGDDCEILPNVLLYENTRLGNRVLVHGGAVIGGYGFGYRQENGQHRRTSQLGWVEIEDDVEIGAAVTIDRGTYGSTRIGAGSKLDNQVQVGHNCQIGKHNLLCSQVGIAGSTTTGDYVVMAGQVGIADHLSIEDRVVVTAQSGVMHNLEADKVYFGSPASPIKQRMQEIALTSRLPQMRRELRAVVKQVAELRSVVENDATDSARPATESLDAA